MRNVEKVLLNSIRLCTEQSRLHFTASDYAKFNCWVHGVGICAVFKNNFNLFGFPQKFNYIFENKWY